MNDKFILLVKTILIILMILASFFLSPHFLLYINVCDISLRIIATAITKLAYKKISKQLILITFR